MSAFFIVIFIYLLLFENKNMSRPQPLHICMHNGMQAGCDIHVSGYSGRRFIRRVTPGIFVEASALAKTIRSFACFSTDCGHWTIGDRGSPINSVWSEHLFHGTFAHTTVSLAHHHCAPIHSFSTPSSCLSLTPYSAEVHNLSIHRISHVSYLF